MGQIANSNFVQSDLFGVQQIVKNVKRQFEKKKIDARMAALVLAHADVSIELGNGCVALRVSKTQAMRENLVTLLGAQSINLCDTVVIWNEWSSSIVNVLHQNLHFEKRIAGKLH